MLGSPPFSLSSLCEDGELSRCLLHPTMVGHARHSSSARADVQAHLQKRFCVETVQPLQAVALADVLYILLTFRGTPAAQQFYWLFDDADPSRDLVPCDSCLYSFRADTVAKLK